MQELSDGNGEIVPAKQYGKPDINELFDYWEFTMGYPITVKKVENRRFANTLLRTRSSEVIQQYVALVAANRSERFVPQVSGFVDLYYKWDKLTEFFMRKQAQGNDIINLD